MLVEWNLVSTRCKPVACPFVWVSVNIYMFLVGVYCSSSHTLQNIALYYANWKVWRCKGNNMYHNNTALYSQLVAGAD